MNNPSQYSDNELADAIKSFRPYLESEIAEWDGRRWMQEALTLHKKGGVVCKALSERKFYIDEWNDRIVNAEEALERANNRIEELADELANYFIDVCIEFRSGKITADELANAITEAEQGE